MIASSDTDYVINHDHGRGENVNASVSIDPELASSSLSALSSSSSSLSSPSLPLLPQSSSTCLVSPSPLRWYICLLFCIYCVLQNSMWGFYAPIQAPLEKVYGWTDQQIEWMANASNVTFIIMVLPISALVTMSSAHTSVSFFHGIRFPVLLCTFALCLNSGLRCLPLHLLGDTCYTALSLLGMCFNGVAGTIEGISPPILSTLWFPVYERTTATAIMATANTLGTVAAFTFAFIVPQDGTQDEILDKLNTIYVTMFVMCVALFVSMIVYFPSKPQHPPSISATVEKVDMKKGIGLLVRSPRFWLVCSCMSFPLGVYFAWLSVLDLNLKNFDFSQNDAAWIGVTSAIAAAVAGIVTARIADKTPGRLCRLIAILYLGASLNMIWFTLLCYGVLPFSLAQAFLSSTFVGLCMSGSVPLFFELIVELTFPVPECCSCALLLLCEISVVTLFLSMPTQLGDGGTEWMNVALGTCPALAAAALGKMKEEDVYVRLKMDIGGEMERERHKDREKEREMRKEKEQEKREDEES